MNLAQLIERLADKGAVDGVAVIGSGADGTFNSASDHDLLIVLHEPPVPLKGGVTQLDGRMADLIFSTTNEIDRLVTAKDMEVATHSLDGTILRWMETASIAIDRNGRLVRLQERSRSGLELIPPQEAEIRSRLDKASYNLAHTRRMLSSDDPTYLTAIDLRLLYQLSDLMADYFVVRGVPWRGEKAAVRYWRAHHPEFLDLFRVYLAETDRVRKVELYAELATMTMAPAGGLWGDGHTGFWLVSESEMTSDNVKEAMAFWETLIDD